jgi:GntR family phosphonate transport system transcriptional regulator
VRRAIADLSTRGIVHARRGAGVFVASVPTDYPLGARVRFHQSVLANGRLPTKRFLMLETRAANGRECQALELDAGQPVTVCEGLSLADRQPMALFRSVFPAERVPTMIERLNAMSSITAALKAEGIADYTRAWTRINAKTASVTLAGQLRIAQGAPVLRTTSLNIDPEGRPIEFGRSWFAADRVTLTVGPQADE